ncbi:MAG TPA: hypothetical protein VFB31_13860 [Pseudolabrys sp.]|nr:hypothetical protein [Pseudolabrys sp.]
MSNRDLTTERRRSGKLRARMRVTGSVIEVDTLVWKRNGGSRIFRGRSLTWRLHELRRLFVAPKAGA